MDPQREVAEEAITKVNVRPVQNQMILQEEEEAIKHLSIIS